ncbi:MAG: type II toxin-antitoxin system VapB family antitoxin [Gammaproteobacteria bacterium]|nr:type II toxin-antitoxin system VapB family antitoxin [Gammaproteobacteria bacterium]
MIAGDTNVLIYAKGDFSMPLNIKNAAAHALAKKIATLTGESMTKVVTEALQEKLARVERAKGRAGLAEELDRIALRCARLPRRDSRSPDEVIGYDERGLPQ